MAANPVLFAAVGVDPKSDLDLARMTEAGFPLASIDELKKLGLTFTEISDIIISPRTLKHRKARGEGLSREETERVIRMARIIAFAEKVFGSHDKAMGWLREADDRLDNRNALQMLKTEAGGRLVENMLYQIDEGAFA